MVSPSEYRDLIESATPAATDADTIEPTVSSLFTPHQHRLALDPDVTVVKGGRGVGKTVWFSSLQSRELRELAAERYRMPRLRKVVASAGYGARPRKDYPSQPRLATLVQNFPPETIWMAVALHGFGAPQLTRLDSWEERIQWVRDDPDAGHDALRELDERAVEEDEIRLVLFDAMERLHSDRAVANRLTTGVLRLSLTLRATKRLRAKVFLRHDMFESAGHDFPDASKLNNSVDLAWDSTSLYSLLFHLMSVEGSDLAGEFNKESGWIAAKEGSETELTDALHLIASQYMGPNHRRGITYRWIPNHLQDGLRQASPRSFLSAIRRAAERTRIAYPEHPRALHWNAIKEGVQFASTIRFGEVEEDSRWVKDALDPLRGCQVPIDADDVIALWDDADLATTLAQQRGRTDELSVEDESVSVPTGPSGFEYSEIISDLHSLGVMTTRVDGRLDLPDVYRIAAGIGRKGGVPLGR